MKKVLVALAMVLGTGSSVVFAQEVNNSSAVVAEAQVPQDEFVKMDPTELPQAILLTLAKNYEGSSVKEAYVKVKDEAKIYKIIILTQDGQETETILNEKAKLSKNNPFQNVNLVKKGFRFVMNRNSCILQRHAVLINPLLAVLPAVPEYPPYAPTPSLPAILCAASSYAPSP